MILSLVNQFKYTFKNNTFVVMDKFMVHCRHLYSPDMLNCIKLEKGFLRKNIVAVSFFQNCAIYPYS